MAGSDEKRVGSNFSQPAPERLPARPRTAGMGSTERRARAGCNARCVHCTRLHLEPYSAMTSLRAACALRIKVSTQ